VPDALPTAQVSYRGIPAKSLQDNTDFLFGSELAAGKTLDILDGLLGLFTPVLKVSHFP
jgi:hypothetical protein